MELLQEELRSHAPAKRTAMTAIAQTGCLQDLFEAQVDIRPLALALESAEDSLSYEDLDQRANQLAHFLRSMGAGPGQLVGLYYHRSVEAIISIMGCLKSGAGYVPIDPVFPEERIGHILEEADCSLVLTQSELADKMRALFSGKVLPTDALIEEIAAQPNFRLSRELTGAAPTDIAYVIYTSGTTGRPKGVVAEHQHVYKYALAFNEACTTIPSDRIYQGFSLGFDGSIEEIWMAYSNGASLIAPTSETARFGNDLAHYLSDMKVSYFSTVPTLLSTITEDIPSLRQIVVSGEACPPELVDRWDKPGRDILNVYGPTEATVNTTSKLCRAGEAITIGKPIPGYEIHLLDGQMQPVALGEKGELYIGGETLAQGYLKQAQLTAERFIIHPSTQERLYRTGDLVRWNEDGELEFFGRIDGQVKIRGYRVELSEIEQVLLEHEAIQSATVRLYEHDGLKELAAYVLADEKGPKVDRNDILNSLKRRLPAYMVPSFLEVLDEFPMLASGKVNRSVLPDPVSPLVREKRELIATSTELEGQIHSAWASILGMSEISAEDDFFTDLGGYSLLAAQIVTRLRDEYDLDVSIRDLYRQPTIQKLAKHLEKKPKQQAEVNIEKTRDVVESVSYVERFTVKGLQALSIFCFYLVGTIPFSIIVYVLNSVFLGDMGMAVGFAVLVGAGLVAWPLALAGAILGKWLLMGKFKAGSIKLWSFAYFRWWLAESLQSASGASVFAGTPLMPLYYRLMGAKVGKDCVIETLLVSAWDLVSIGEGTTVASDSQLQGYRIEGGRIHFGQIEVGRRCYIGGHSTLGLNTCMEDACALEHQSYLADGTRMKAGEMRNGSPAVPCKITLPENKKPGPAWSRPVLWSGIFLSVLSMSWLAALVTSLLALSTFLGVYWVAGIPGVVAWLVLSVPLGIVLYCLMLVALRYLIMPKVQTGIFPIQSMAYLRRWMLDGLMRINREVLKPLYSTMYLPAWLRLMGAKIGKRAEISTLWYCSPELIEIEAESFFADGCIIGGRRSFGGVFQVEKNHIGRRSFVGNGANVPTGKSIGDNCLIGVLSSPPTDKETVPDGSEWLGNPAFHLPHRKKVEDFSATETFKPSRSLYAKRAVIDAIRILLPGYLGTAAFLLEMGALVVLYWSVGLAWMVALSPIITFSLVLFSVFSVVALKWMIMGRFQPTIKPLWCVYIWFNEMVNAMYESIFTPLVSMFLGTPFIAPFLRAMGMKVGKNTYIASILFSEFDLIEIGDYASLEVGSVLQTHLFEDRVFKSSRLKVGEGCSVGNMAIVLYDSEMGAESKLGPLSLLMKGENLSPGSRWHGIPTVQCG